MKTDITTGRIRPAGFLGRICHILPYIRLFYNPTQFLETGVTTPALTLETGWLYWGWWLTIQKIY
jgi:hypothetical protein